MNENNNDDNDINNTTRRTEEDPMSEQQTPQNAHHDTEQVGEETPARARTNRRRFPEGPPSIADMLAKPASWAVHETSRVLGELVELVEQQQRQLRQASSVLQATERARTLPPAIAGRVREMIEDVEDTVTRVGAKLTGRGEGDETGESGK